MKNQILHQQGRSQRAIAKELGVSRNTVKLYLNPKIDRPIYPKRETKHSILDTFKLFLHSRIAHAKPIHLSAVALLREIKALGYKGSLSLL
ncbi:helix-turn-helix domain-containing protein [Marinomonas algicola]|uniref:helix-turn-helix domain-containing protein n=1 Tax=Marinomonas algicola TaxID=2773454 RepID=UPI00174E8DED|nr:helix-turn-helix domain-containing protein [Marinomonas algicola]